jgi:hypothetical protein
VHRRFNCIRIKRSQAEAIALGSTDDQPDDELRATVTAAIEQWKTSRQLPHLSPNDCETLNKLIITGLQSVLFQRAKAFDKR